MLKKFNDNKIKNIFDDREFDEFNGGSCMNSELIKKLLDTKTEEQFFEILDNDESLNEEQDENIDLWDKSVVEHCMKLTGLSYDELKETMMIDELE